jgi:hypothetical protein
LSRSFDSLEDAELLIGELDAAACQGVASTEDLLCTDHADLRQHLGRVWRREVLVQAGTCVARGYCPEPGTYSMCGATATRTASGVPLCDQHYETARRWHAEEARREDETAGAEERARALRARRKLMRGWRAQAPGAPVVYYIRRTSDGLIKIGTTVYMRGRMKAIAKEHATVIEILVTHIGAADREHEMHRQFADLRVTGEWFRPEPALLDFIAETRRRPENAEVVEGTVPLGYILELGQQSAA